MPRRSNRFSSLTVALVLLIGTASTGAAFAQETTTPPTTTPTTTTEPAAPTTTPSVPTSSEPAKVDEDPPRPDLRVSVVLDKDHYSSHEIVHATVTITNAGLGVATQVRVFDDGLVNTWRTWGDWWLGSSGGHLEPGMSVVVDINARIDHLTDGKLRYSVDVSEGWWSRGQASAEAEVTVTVGSVSGLIYVDRNRNGTPDEGEALAGATPHLSGGVPSSYLNATTGQDGRFAFNDINTGSYNVSYSLPDGWVVYGGSDLFHWTVEPGQSVEMTIAVTRPVSELLTVSMALDKDVYAVGDQVHLAVTLTNLVTWDITGVTAQCDTNRENYLVPSAPGWGVFAPGGGGATVAAGQTVTIVVTDVIRDVGRVYGLVGATCRFAPGDGIYTRTEVTDTARVPGGIGRVVGRAAETRGSPPLSAANIEIAFFDRGTKEFAGRATTDWYGRFVVGEVPAGEYTVSMIGWASSTVVQVKADITNNVFIVVSPIPIPAPTTTPAPGPGGGAPPPGEDLAATGANVTGLSILGLVALLAGVGAVVASRRQRTT